MVLITGPAWPTGTALAETPITIDTVVVDFWPEYDQPGVTIFYAIELMPDMELPLELSLRIPTNAVLLSVSSGEEDNQEQLLEWELAADGQGQNLQFTTSAPKIRLAVYDPGTVKQDQLRSYSFEWLSTYSVNTLTFTLQIPYCAGALSTNPQMYPAETSSQNCTYYMFEAGQVEAGEAFPVFFQYEKDPSNPAYSALSVYAAEEINDSTRGRTASPLSVVIWLAAVALAVTILVGLYYWWFRRRAADQPTLPVRGVGIDNPEKQAIFCHECGSRSRPGDTYCRNCGTELRRFN